jgi:hypothetical protein
MIRKSSKTTKKGCLEKIYKAYTLPIVFKKNDGICVCCNKREAEGGHHIFGREKDYYHIHPDFVVPVCNWCHSLEKTNKSEDFLISCENWHFDNFKFLNPMVQFFLGEEDAEDYDLKNWAYDKLIEFGFKER